MNVNKQLSQHLKKQKKTNQKYLHSVSFDIIYPKFFFLDNELNIMKC